MVKWVLTDKQMEHINNQSPELLISGSAGSGKTTFAVTKVLRYVLEYDGARAYVFRKTLPSIKKTVLKEFRKLLRDYNIDHKENKTDAEISFPNGSSIMFSGLDDYAKIRSVNADILMIEQAEEITSYDVYAELKLRVRGTVSQKYYPQLIAVVQPEGKDHWIYDYFYKKGYGEVLFFSYLDNPFLPPAHREYYDRLEDVDPDLYRKYTLGEWGASSTQIYENYDHQERSVFEYYTMGVDFGYNNPSAVLLIGWFDDECYVIDEVYQSELLVDELIERTKLMLYRHDLTVDSLNRVYADSASPEAIERFYRADFPIVGANKDVLAGIETTKQTKLHVSKRCKNTIEELQGYSWQKDKNGNITDKPVKMRDHAVDALRYCVYGVRGYLSPDKPVSDVDLEDIYFY